MDVGLVLLGVLILFGATILIKAAGFEREQQPDYAISSSSGRQTAPPATQPRFEDSKTPAPPAEVKTDELRKQCKYCMSENWIDAKFCANCGKSLTDSEMPGIFQKHEAWFRMHGWSRNPFTLDVIPSLFVGYKDEIRKVMDKIAAGSGHILITGGIGTGKTTLLRWLEINMPKDYHTLYVFRPPERFDDLIALMVSSAQSSNRAIKPEYNIYNLNVMVEKLGKRFVVLLDEAHEFSSDVSKPLKTLGDVHGVTLIMAGLTELDANLRKDSAPLYDRLVAKVTLHNLGEEEIKMLVSKRVENVGGWGIEPFTEAALKEVFKLTHGQPRSVIKLCDATVSEAIRGGLLSIDDKVVRRAAEAMTGAKPGD
jgi:type II secretory pathway predicted ATPase ExeA